MIVCIKKATKCVVICPSQNDLNGALDVDVYQIYCWYLPSCAPLLMGSTEMTYGCISLCHIKAKNKYIHSYVLLLLWGMCGMSVSSYC